MLQRLEAVLTRLVQDSNRRERCETTLHTLSRSAPALSDENLMAALEAASEDATPGRWQRLPSGAGHDAQYMARHMPAVMLFVPSIGGISHHWSEDTSDEDLAMGALVLVAGASRFLGLG